MTASIWYSNNTSDVIYLQLKNAQQANYNGQQLNIYVNGNVQNTPIKRVLGYGTAKGSYVLGNKRFELANHLGNVLEVISDRKWGLDDGVYNPTTGVKTSSTQDGFVDFYMADIITYSDYYPFGMTQEDRSGSVNHRYGYQGSESDDEVKGEGNSYTTQFRQLDPRIGRWLTIDPKPEAGMSPYCSMDNNPIKYNDVRGLYTKRRAERMAQKATDNGYDPSKLKNVTGKRNGWNFDVTQRNNEDNGTYRRTMMNGKFRGFEDKDLNLDSDLKTEIIPSEANLAAPAGVLALSLEGAGASSWMGPVGAVFGAAIYAGVNIDLTNQAYSSTLPSVSISGPVAIPIDYTSTDGITTVPSGGYVTLFRGVNENHPDYQNAKFGTATPQNVFSGHTNESWHNGGNTNSVFTSWTVNPWVAYQFATRKYSSHGIVLVKSFHISEINTNSPDKFWQGEVLIRGTVRGAVPVPTSTPLIAQ